MFCVEEIVQIPSYEGCQSAYYPSFGLNYTKVCGQVRGYKYQYPGGFYCTKKNIENAYVYGVSITKDSPRQHIWTYAAGDDENNPILLLTVHVTLAILTMTSNLNLLVMTIIVNQHLAMPLV